MTPDSTTHVHTEGHSTGEHGTDDPAPSSLFGPPLVIAHRAKTPGAVPNAVSSIALAAAAGADLIEMDIRLSLDRRPVLVHDAMLGVSTTGRGWVRLWPEAALRRLHHAIDPEQTIDSLDAALAAVPPTAQLALHLKDRGALRAVLRRIERAGQAHRTWLWLEGASDVVEANRRLPALRITLLRANGWQPGKRDAYFREAQWAGANAVSLPPGVIDTDMVTAAHQHHLRVFTRIDHAALAPQLARLGVDGFIVPDPAATRAALDAQE